MSEWNCDHEGNYGCHLRRNLAHPTLCVFHNPAMKLFILNFQIIPLSKDAYFVVERYADQLADEEMAENTIVIPRTVQEISAPQVTTYNGFTSSYPFTASRQAHGVTVGQDPSNRV
jgi:hypothetical protein